MGAGLSVSNMLVFKPIKPPLILSKFADLFGGVAGGVPRLRAFATATGAIDQARGAGRRHNESPLLARCQQRAAVSSLSNPRRPAGRRRSVRTSSSSASAAAGQGGAGDEVTFGVSDAAARRNADPDSVAFVTGANRGIGLEVTRQLLMRSKGERVLEWPRSPRWTVVVSRPREPPPRVACTRAVAGG